MISIIVPVYNVEKYLECCLNSILKQSFIDYELILVDDGSVDNSLNICNDFAQKDNRIRIIYKENGGAVSALNAGLKDVRGEYVCFIDSDDFVAEDYLQSLIDGMADDIDMVCMNCTRYFDDKKQYDYKINNWSDGLHELDVDFYSEFICWDRKLIANSRWAKLIKTEIAVKYAKYCSEQVTCGEDQQLIIGILLGCKKVRLINEYKYFYRCNFNSIMNSYKKNLWEKYNVFINAIRNIPEITDVTDIEKQLNGKLVLSICECLENEQYFGGGLTKRYFEYLVSEAKTMGLFDNYKISNVGRVHNIMIDCIKNKRFYKLKSILRMKKLYEKLAKKQ